MKGKIFMFLLVGLFAISFICATATIVSPGASATLTGTSVLNASGVALVNCTFATSSPSTANSSSSSLGIFYNVSADANAINGTFASAGLEDSNDYTFTVSCYNASGGLHTGTRSGITISNTVPTAPTIVSPVAGSSDDDGSVVFSGTVVDATTTGCTLYFVGTNPGATSYAMTYSTTSCTKTLTMPSQTYKYYITATDGVSTTDSTVTTFNVDIPEGSSSGAVAQYIAQGGEVKNAEGKTLAIGPEGLTTEDNTVWWIIVIILLLVIGYLIYKRR